MRGFRGKVVFSKYELRILINDLGSIFFFYFNGPTYVIILTLYTLGKLGFVNLKERMSGFWGAQIVTLRSPASNKTSDRPGLYQFLNSYNINNN